VGSNELVGRSICPTSEARDGLWEYGMEGGMAEGYERLEKLLSSECRPAR
jgi:hypothetical protein